MFVHLERCENCGEHSPFVAYDCPDCKIAELPKLQQKVDRRRRRYPQGDVPP
jgi:hypothetical protein